MSRAERLLGLIDELRSRKRPASGESLAEKMGVSIRTLYRDIASLRAQGAPIDGEPGLGFVLKPGFLLPPLMFPGDEIEALALGASWVAERADIKLATAAQNALARIGGVIPAHLAHRIENQHLVIGPAVDPAARQVDLSIFRAAIRNERKLRIAYIDSKGVGSDRVVWPFQIGFFDGVSLLSAWCESRNSIRHFRTDRIESAVEAGGRYPKRRHELVTMWQKIERPDKARP